MAIQIEPAILFRFIQAQHFFFACERKPEKHYRVKGEPDRHAAQHKISQPGLFRDQGNAKQDRCRRHPANCH